MSPSLKTFEGKPQHESRKTGSEDVHRALEGQGEETLKVPLEMLDDGPFQERRGMSETALRELVDSIREHGLLQPISVCRKGERFEILAGHRRATAFRRLHAEARTDEERTRFTSVPAIARAIVSDEAKLVFGLVENLQRADLSAVEEASGVARLVDLGLSPKDVAIKLAKKEERVRRLLRLHQSPEVVKEAVTKGIMVSTFDDEAGETNGPGREHRRRLDLMPALQFAKLHRYLLGKAPRHADDRTRAALERALGAGWSEKRIKVYVDRIIAGRGEGEPMNGGESLRPPKPGFSATSRALLVRLDRVPQLASQERIELAAMLRKILATLEAPRQSAAPSLAGSAAQGV